MDPWPIVGWMIIGSVGGLALRGLIDSLDETFNSILLSLGPRITMLLVWLIFTASVFFFAPVWIFILCLVITANGFVFWLRPKTETVDGTRTG